MAEPIDIQWVSGGGGVPLDDRMLTHGLGVFETILAVDGQLVRPEYHISRMADACDRLGMRAPDWRAVIDEIHERLPDSGWQRVRVARSAGSGALNQIAGQAPLTLIAISSLPPRSKTLRVVTLPWPRHESSPLAGVKCSSYAESLLALDHARRVGAEEGIFLNTRGHLSEAATANLFIIREGRFLTPPLADGCLAGTTRRWILETFPEQASEQSLSPAGIHAADGMFLTSATRGPVAVGEWDGREIACPIAFSHLRAAWESSLGTGH